MIIKFVKLLADYDYLVMFDLASKTTGVCLWDLKNHKPVKTDILKVTGKKELASEELYLLIQDYFEKLQESGYDLKKILVSKEAAPLQAGKFTTAQTLIALGKAHAILDFCCAWNKIDVYDYNGIAPITTHSYFKHIMGWDNKHPVDKTDILLYLKNTYPIGDITLDESDAVFLAQTLVESHWNKQIDEQIREVKRHRKTLKAPHAIKGCDEEILRLQYLKI